MSEEVRGRIEEMLVRAEALGASPEQLQWITDEWDRMDAGDQEELYRANDAVLGQRLRDGQADADTVKRAESPTPTTDDEIAAYERARAEQAEQDWGLLGLNIKTILETIDGNPELAHRLYLLEETANDPRKTLLDALEKVAWPHGRPAEDEDDEEAEDE